MTKLDDPESDLLIMSMTADQIEWQEVLLPINQNYDKIWERKWTSVIHFHKKAIVNLAKCTITAHAHDTYYTVTQA